MGFHGRKAGQIAICTPARVYGVPRYVDGPTK
jgi:hypothetical protein